MVYNKMDKFDNRYNLAGKILVALPSLNNDEYFAGSVVYMCMHQPNGAMGIVINKRMNEYTFSDLTMTMSLKNYTKLSQIGVYSGGPLEKARGMVLHSVDYRREDTQVIGNGIAISSDAQIIADIAFDNGPAEKLVALGYSFWQPSQLEREIYDNRWLVLDADRELLFRTKDEYKWQKALDDSGIRLDNFVNITGHC